ncbi:MAG: hypothetical protein ACYSWP_13370 [Planctomycetota bacterium]|jgi:hypothetical protein
MRLKSIIWQLMITLVFTCYFWDCQGYGGTRNTKDLTLKGTASGGTLVLARTLNRYQQNISIVTHPGESSESVVRRLADTINAWNRNVPTGQVVFWGGRYQARTNGSTIKLTPGLYAIAGTEKGLGIPRPPKSLSCSYKPTSDKVELRWINPEGAYDSIQVRWFWNDLDSSGSERLEGSANVLILDKAKMNLNNFDASVVGYRDNIPSNSIGVHLSEHVQSEKYGIPFSDGIAPNWTAWSSGPKVTTTAFEQDKRWEPYIGSFKTLSAKPFVQVIKAPTSGTVHGIWRKFLGLTPEHTYRFTADLSTLKMDSVNSDWELAVCAVANGVDGKNLTSQQMAGLSALPDGSKGLKAGRKFSYGPRNTTNGIWEVALTGHKTLSRPASQHITMPAGVDTLTVWLRFSCSDPNAQVSFSGVMLEDITAAGTKITTPGDIIKKERKQKTYLFDAEARIKEQAVIERTKNKYRQE